MPKAAVQAASCSAGISHDPLVMRESRALPSRLTGRRRTELVMLAPLPRRAPIPAEFGGVWYCGRSCGVIAAGPPSTACGIGMGAPSPYVPGDLAAVAPATLHGDADGDEAGVLPDE